MNNYQEKRNRRLYETVSLTKLLSIFFCGIIFFSAYGERLGNGYVIKSTITPITLCFVAMAILILMYKVWTFSNESKRLMGLNIRSIIETIVFITVFFSLILVSGAHESPHKVVFLFIIATSTIEFGKKAGINVAAICGGLVLLMDLTSAPTSMINRYFEADLVLLGVFLLTSWLLGDYVEIEAKYTAQIINMANKDDLTGVCNHRFFQQAMRQEIEKRREFNQPISLLFIDIDYFKNYNDLYGHMAGDQLLVQLASLIKNIVRDKDVVARYGGDEFAIILPNTTEKDAVLIGERIRKGIDEKYFEGEENLPKSTITASIGISSFPDKAKTKDDLIKSADDALYRAKFFNRNRVEVYSSILEELKEDIQEEHIDIISSVKTLISVINAKDKYTYGHTERVVTYCDLMAKELDLPEEDQKKLKYGAYLHDIGKIETPQEILNKKMRLTEEEWQYIKKHPEDGAEIIKPVPALEEVIPLVLHHHERYDGQGYPSQLKGEDIPYCVRILSIADSFDAMTSNRPYQLRRSYEEAIIELKRSKATQFDPELVDLFVVAIQKSR